MKTQWSYALSLLKVSPVNKRLLSQIVPILPLKNILLWFPTCKKTSSARCWAPSHCINYRIQKTWVYPLFQVSGWKAETAYNNKLEIVDPHYKKDQSFKIKTHSCTKKAMLYSYHPINYLWGETECETIYVKEQPLLVTVHFLIQFECHNKANAWCKDILRGNKEVSVPMFQMSQGNETS